MGHPDTEPKPIARRPVRRVIGLAVKSLGQALVDTPSGQVQTQRHHLITPHYAGTLFHDERGRWIKALIEAKGEIIEYAPSWLTR